MTDGPVIGHEGELLPGTSYRLVKRLGGGGMGSVYIAEHTALGRRDAVKLLAPHIAEDEQAMKRLEREARATAALANPHIIDIYTLGVTTDKRPYVAMRLIQGSSLKEIVDRERRLDVERSWLLLRQVCVALQSAHEAGIVHRDLKPDNLMVEPRDAGEFVTILDFGIAKVEAETESRLTRDGQVIGTPGYMAPEQALGRAVDGRADQYSIGAIFYELISGGFPYDRMGALQTITQQITQDARPLSALVNEAEVPAALQALIMQALSREAADRLPTLQAFVQAVDAAVGYVPPAASRTRLTMEAAAAPAPVSPGAPRTGLRLWGPVLGLAMAVGAGVAVFVSVGKGPAAVAPADKGGGSSVTTAVAEPRPAELPTAAPPASTASAGPASSPPSALVSAAPASSAPSVSPSVAPAAAPASAVAVRPAAPRSNGLASTGAPSPPAPVSAAAPATQAAALVAAPPTAAPAPATQPAALIAAPPTAAPPPPPAAPPRLVVDALKIVGGGSAQDIKKRMAAAEGTIRTCIARSPDLKAGAAATVGVVIDADGFFGDPTVSGDAALARCALSAIKGARLDRRPDTGDIRVTVPLRLEAP